MLKLIRADRPWNQYRFPPELIAWRDAVIANGGARPSVREMVRRNRLIRNHMLSGAWALTDDILMSGEDEVQSLVSLKRRFLCIRWNSPQFYAESGFILDGYASYIEWPFIPATHAVAMTTTNKRIAAWNLANIQASTTGMGVNTNSLNNKLLMRFRNTDDEMVVSINCQPSPRFDLPEPFDSRGLSVGSTSSPTIVRAYKNGVLLGEKTATVFSGLPTHSIFLGTVNSQGTPGEFVRTVLPYAAIGAQLTDAQERATYEGVRDAVARMFYGEDDEEDD